MSTKNQIDHKNFVALKFKTLKNLPTSITCSALNYLTHKLMLCTKDRIFLYDLHNPNIIRQKSYAKDLGKFYEAEVEIKSIDAMIMTNIWVALVNKKSFIFFNDYLEFTRVYTVSPNPIFSIQVAQRTNDLITIRDDRKAIRFWNCQITDEISSDQIGFDLSGGIENKHEGYTKTSLSTHRDRDREKYGSSTNRDGNEGGKDKLLKELGYTFDVSVVTKKQIILPSNRFIMKLDFSEEFRILAIAADNSDVLLYSLVSAELTHTLNFCKNPELTATPHISIDQEILYYCDEKRIVAYDLSLHEETYHHHHGLNARIAYFHAQRSTRASGIYILTLEEKLYIYSCSQKKAIRSLDLHVLDDRFTDFARSTFINKLTKTMTSSVLFSDYKHSLESLDNNGNKCDMTLKDQISKLKLQFSTDMNTNGLLTLIISKPGMFNAFDVMSSLETLYSSTTPIQRIVPIESNLKLELADNTIQDLSLTNPSKNKNNTKSLLDLMALWKKSFQEMIKPKDEYLPDINSPVIREIHILHQDELFVIQTKTHLYVGSWKCHKVVSQPLTSAEIITCISISLNNESFGSYYVILGTNKGVILVAEVDFSLKTLNVLKTMPKHSSVLSLRHLEEYNALLSIGAEGDIFFYSVTRPEEHRKFPTRQVHRLIWNHVTAIGFFNDTDIIAGFDNGVIQFAKFSWKNSTNIESKLFEYHTSPIQKICIIEIDSIKYFAASDQENVISLWSIYESVPLKIFRFGSPIVSLFINENQALNQINVYCASKDDIVKFDYNYGGWIASLPKDHLFDWNDALSLRSKNFARTIKDGSALEAVLTKMETQLKKYKKSNPTSVHSGPIMTSVIYNNPQYVSMNSLEADFLQYASQEHPKNSRKGDFWILDTILNGFHQKKVLNEPLIFKPEKTTKKTQSNASWQDQLTTTLRRFPFIKSCLLEKEKDKEMQELHKHIVNLINVTYTGEDNLEQIYEFLEKKHEIKRADIDEAYLQRAKKLYYRRPPPPTNLDRIRSTSPILDEIPQSHFVSKNSSMIISPHRRVKLPTLSIEQSNKPTSRSPVLGEKSTAAKSSTKFKSNVQHYKTNSETFYRPTTNHFLSPSRLASPTSALTSVLSNKSPTTKTHHYTKTETNAKSIHDSHYQPYSTTRSWNSRANLKLGPNFSFSPSPAIAAVLTTPRSHQNEDKLGIGTDENTLRSPFFVTKRGDMNRDVFLTEISPRKPYMGPVISNIFNKTTTSMNSPSKDFVTLHSKGFQTSENVDLFNHVLRLLLKNHHLLKTELVNTKSKNSTYKQNTERFAQNSDDSDEDSIDYIPIEIKQFVLDVSKKELEVLENIVAMYENQTGNRLNTNENFKSDDTYTTAKLEVDMAKENDFLEEILKKINDSGVESISLNQMVKFKQIMRKRLQVFTRLQTHIEISGLLQSKPTTAQEAQFKEELQHTFRQVQKIAELHPLLSFRDHSINPTSLGFDSRNILSSRDGMRSSMTPFNPKTEFSTNNPDNMVTSIKKSIETTRVLNRTVKELKKGRKTISPVQRAGSLEEIAEKAVKFQEPEPWEKRRPRVRSLTSLTPVQDSDRKEGERTPNQGGGDEKKDALEKQNTIAAIVKEVKRKRRPSLTLPKRKTQKHLTHQVSRTDLDKDAPAPLTAQERKKRLERLLAKDPEPIETNRDEEEEEIKEENEERDRRKMALKEIERAWKEKDFEFLRSYLRGPTIKVDSLKDTAGDQNKKGSEENGRRKKKKKKNPNVSTNSGGLTTLAKDKYRKTSSGIIKGGDQEAQHSPREGYGINDSIEEEDEDEDDVFSQKISKNDKNSLLKSRKSFHIDINKALKGKRSGTGDGKRQKISHRQGTLIEQRDEKQENTNAIVNDKKSKKLAKNPSDPIGFSMIKGETMGMSQWQKGEAHVEQGKNDQFNPMSRYAMGNMAFDNNKDEKGKKILTEAAAKLKFKDASKVLERLTGIKKESLDESVQSKHTGNDPKSSNNESIVSGFGGIGSSGLKETSQVKADLKSKKTLLNKKDDEVQSKNISLDETNKTVNETDDKKKDLNVSGTGKKNNTSTSFNSSKVSEKGLERTRTGLAGNLNKLQPTIKEEKSPENKTLTKTPKSKKVTPPVNLASNEETADGNDEQKEESKDQSPSKGGKAAKLKEKQKTIEQDKKEAKILEIRKLNSQATGGQETIQTVTSEESKWTNSPQKQNSTSEMSSPKVNNTLKSKELAVSVRKRNNQGLSNNARDEAGSQVSESSPTESLNTVEEASTADLKSRRSKISKRMESPNPEGEIFLHRRRATRNTLRSEFEGKTTEDLLDDPMKLLSTVLKVQEIDQETKLDLFFYGNRKQAMKDFLKEIEETIEHNVLKQDECMNLLDGFYDTKLNTLLLTRSSNLRTHQRAANFDAQIAWKRSSTRIISPEFDPDDDNPQPVLPAHLTSKAALEYLHEQARRQNFAKNRALVQTIKTYDEKKCKVLTYGYMGVTNDIRNGKGVLSPTVMETLLQNKNATLLEVMKDPEPEEEEEIFEQEYIEKQEKEAQELMGRIERIRRFLQELKKRDPPHFRELVQTLEENKNFYHIMMNDINDGRERQNTI